ncbi:hypothetical protein EYF80_054958 [Liparis tanakae]|uniref:Uncharacterized protein n=1 Tax=Liparis tanakae TaxID=230148 RepID=A0A4Z2F1H1_9TELE|nr:hypothetical protein EYF80_054958 [Liparis tanakae]
MGSSDQSLQSFTLSHTLLTSTHSPFLQRNFLGPSHFVTAEETRRAEGSASPSHFQFPWTHSPLPHWNSPAGQRGFWGSVRRLQRSRDSSDLSLQSGSPSQLHRAGMHSESLQRNSCWPQAGVEHLSSSLPSPQSSSPSHTKLGPTHFPLRQAKSLEGQALACQTAYQLTASWFWRGGLMVRILDKRRIRLLCEPSV